MSIPPWPSSRTSPLVQLCHGTPGLLILLGTAHRNKEFKDLYWDESWEGALQVAIEKVWAEGVLSKGLGICHGIAGNAMTFLLVNEGSYFSEITDDYLGKGLAMLLLAREAPPYSQQVNESRKYRMPDNPFSLYEGLAGTMCAWADACAIIEARIRALELESHGKGDEEIRRDEVIRQRLECQLGVPGLGYVA
jgi:hypothetical protein